MPSRPIYVDGYCRCCEDSRTFKYQGVQHFEVDNSDEGLTLYGCLECGGTHSLKYILENRKVFKG